jgi:hypothetical protein
MTEQLCTWYRRNGRRVLRHWLSQPDRARLPRLWRGLCGIRYNEITDPRGVSSLIADLGAPVCRTCAARYAALHPQEEPQP